MEEMRWFLVPYEAHLYLTGTKPPKIQIPYEPRNYERDTWYTSDYLNEWDEHWNPGYWEEVKSQRISGQQSSVEKSRNQWQWTIYPANHSPIHLQPISYYEPLSTRRKKAFASVECLISSEMKVDTNGSTASLASPRSSGYSSDDAIGKDTVVEVSERRERFNNKKTMFPFDHDSRSGKKCIVM